ncbi:hypothetical protein GCM10012275_58290 [Longimycelium tulufanense]|uniref:Uncharacterized protein n=1 Tax=Longimycelium tulufanense TaxID=907463 RepID=A0A8J3CKY2_9PSEU|nr:hypothetical protein [Longimycelium tulufanense]GGM80047.1 hypothetical protein GCM10012275_58290 [Longimycelium tulufanense]
MTGGPSNGASHSLIGVASGGVGGKRGGARLAHRDLTTHPGSSYRDSLPGSIIFRVPLLEVGEHMLGAVSGPEHR